MNNHPIKTRVSPHLVILIGILAVSTASVFIRFAQAEAHSLVIAAWRLSLATLVIAPFALKNYGAEIKALARKEIWLAILSGFFLSLHFAAWITSLELTSVASSVVMVTTTPLWAALLSPIFLREPISKRVVWGLLFALLGGIVVAMSDACTFAGGLRCPELGALAQGETFVGNMLALVGAMTGAGYFMIGRSLRARMNLVPYVFLVYGVASVFLIGYMVGFEKPAFGYSPTIYLWLILLALGPQVLGHSSFNWALGHLPAAFVTITLLGEPVATIILAYLILGEAPAPVKLIGAILILFGIYIASTRRKRAVDGEEKE